MKYCAFLRGVNVNGIAMKMTHVCEVFAKAGMYEVSTVLATGNILFSSDLKVSQLKIILEKSLSDYFNYEAFLFLKTEKEVREIAENNPFQNSAESHIYAFVGLNGIEQKLLIEFNQSIKDESEHTEIKNNYFYWKVLKGNTLNSSLGKILGKKSLKSQMTSRNINTIEKIVNKF